MGRNVGPPQSQDTAETTAALGASERNGDELRRIVGFHSHEHRMLAILLGLADGFAYIRRGSDLGPADLKDDVATLEPMLGGKSVGIDLSDHHAFRPASCNLAGRGNRHAKLRQAGACGSESGLVARASLDFGSSPRVSEKLFSSPLRQTVSFTVAPGVIGTDLLGEVVSVLDCVPVHGRDDIAGDNASLWPRGYLLVARRQARPQFPSGRDLLQCRR